MNRVAVNRIAKRVATHLWKFDGEPEKQGDEPTSVGRDTYEFWASDVVDGLLTLGYTITPPKRAKP